VRPPEKEVQAAGRQGRWFIMDLVKVDSGAEIASDVSRTFWRQTLLTSCVLAGCLALIVVLVAF
jgi:hypothetical protein